MSYIALIVGVSEAKPLSSGWCKTGRLGIYHVCHRSRGITWVHSIYGWLVACLLLWTAHDHRFACLPQAKCPGPLVRTCLVWCSSLYKPLFGTNTGYHSWPNVPPLFHAGGCQRVWSGSLQQVTLKRYKGDIATIMDSFVHE